MRKVACLFVAGFLAQAADLKERFLAITGGWTEGVTFTKAEQEAMDRGRQHEDVLMTALDDPLAKKVIRGGEPSFEALAGIYPGKVLDRTVLGVYSDPLRPPRPDDNEFTIWWNGAISANLLRGPNGQPEAKNTNIAFRVGAQAEMFGLHGERYSRLRYQDGHLPIVTATYQHDGIRYTQTAFAESANLALVRFEMKNVSRTRRTAELFVDIALADGTRVKAGRGQIEDAAGRGLLGHADEGKFDAERQRLAHTRTLEPGASTHIDFQIPYVPGAVGRGSGYEKSYASARKFWAGLLARGTYISVPEERVNQVWRALLLQNFVLADGQRFTYGSGLRYNDSYYPVENGFGAHTFAMYGHGDYASELLKFSVPVSVHAGQAGRKYQNRRGIPFHHLLENYRLTGRTDTYDRYEADLHRVAEEIISDRRLSMTETSGAKPLHWGFLPPDKPGVDLRASTQTVYVTAHNISSCQGLQDFGDFLVRSGLDPGRGKRYLEEARQFRRDLMSAMERSAIQVPGRPPFVDLQTLYFRETPDYGPDPYDDLGMGRLQGVYYHYWADMQYMFNFFDPDDAPGRWIADYVAQRGGFVLGCTRARRRPEQPYGWINNVYNAGYYNYRLRAGSRAEFLLGFYARLAFGMSRHVYVGSEGSPFVGYNTQRGGFIDGDAYFPNSAANAETLLMLRNALILEELKANQETGVLHLLKGVPGAWLAPGKKIEVLRAPTYFGQASFTVESAPGRLHVRITPPSKAGLRGLVLNLPPAVRVRKATVNGLDHKDFTPGAVRLRAGEPSYHVELQYDSRAL